MKDNYKDIFIPTKCPSVSVLENYMSDNLSQQERHDVESHLADCDMCSDILDGMSNMSGLDQADNIEKKIHARIDNELIKRKTGTFRLRPYYYSVAASVLIVIGVSFFIRHYSEKGSQISENMSQASEKVEQQAGTDNAEKATKQDQETAKAPEKQIISKESSKQPVSDDMTLNGKSASKSEKEVTIKVEKQDDISAAPAEPEEKPAIAIAEEDIDIKPNDESEESITGSGRASAKAPDRITLIADDMRRSENVSSHTIKGKVVDMETGEPVPGTNIIIRGTAEGTVTDPDGTFVIKAPENKIGLDFLSVGYTSKSISLDGEKNIIVRLEPEKLAMEEVVVVEDQAGRQDDKTGAVSTVSGDELMGFPDRQKKSKISSDLFGKVNKVPEHTTDKQLQQPEYHHPDTDFDISGTYDKAMSHYQKKEYKNAAEFFGELYLNIPVNDSLTYYYADALFKSGMPVISQKIITRYLKNEPETVDANIYYLLAQVLTERGRTDSAISILNELKKQDSVHLPAIQELLHQIQE